MITEPITQDLREKARVIAESRYKVSKHRKGGLFPGMPPLDMHWTGAIAELGLIQRYSYLKSSQSLVMYDSNTLASDLIFSSVGIEVKCRRFPTMYRHYFVNQRHFHKKSHLSKIHILCGINDYPKTATELYILGIIENTQIPKYDVESRYDSPAYSVPVRDIICLKENSERSQELQERVLGFINNKPVDLVEWLK